MFDIYPTTCKQQLSYSVCKRYNILNHESDSVLLCSVRSNVKCPYCKLQFESILYNLYQYNIDDLFLVSAFYLITTIEKR